MNHLKIFLVFIVLNVFGACKDEPSDPTSYENRSGLLIGNEGNFLYGNASLSYYDLEKDKIENQIFFRVNNLPLGDVLQSITIMGDYAYLVINNSGKIIVMNKTDFTYVHTITGFTSPRYIVFASSDKAYVSDLYASEIFVVNIPTRSISGSVDIGSSSENMLIYDGFLYVTSWRSNNKLYKIDINTDELIDSLQVGWQPNSMVMDHRKRLWVLSDGAYENVSAYYENASLICVETGTFSIQKSIIFPNMAADPNRLTINATKNTLFLCNSGNFDEAGIYKMPVNANELQTQPFIKEGNRNFYGLGIDPVTSEIFVTDARDYLQPGTLFRYDQHGSLLDSVRADIIPSFIVIDR